MKESYKVDLASNFGLELYADDGNGLGVATAEVYAGKLMSSEINHSVRRHCCVCGKAISWVASWRATQQHGGVEEPEHA